LNHYNGRHFDSQGDCGLHPWPGCCQAFLVADSSLQIPSFQL
jgi:hypothetical protein